MSIDTRGFRQEQVGKRLRIELAEGEECEIELDEITVCAEPEPCCGITYTLLACNREGEGRRVGRTYWSGFDEVKSFQIL